MSIDTSSGGVYITSEGVISSAEEAYRGRWSHREVIGTQVEAGTEGGRTIRGGPYATLKLRILDAGGEVRHIRPKDTLAFGIIERNTIGHNVDPCGIDPTDT